MSVVLSKATVQRLIKDVREVMYQQPLHEQGIYYLHDDTDMLVGYALIVGPADTPYEGGYFLFRFQFPADYPYSPPKVTFCTNGDRVRFNPNLYCNGKVCVSLLNTWRGEQWSACQSISTVLLAICSLLNEQPMENEPGQNESPEATEEYHRILRAATANIAICDLLERRPGVYYPFFELFREVMVQRFLANRERLLATWRLQQQQQQQRPQLLRSKFYNFSYVVDADAIVGRLLEAAVAVAVTNQKKIELLQQKEEEGTEAATTS